jgi:hypothetical protein
MKKLIVFEKKLGVGWKSVFGADKLISLVSLIGG